MIETTLKERTALVEKFLKTHPDLSLKEAYTYVYYWFKYERALLKFKSAYRRMERYGKKLDAFEMTADVEKMKNTL